MLKILLIAAFAILVLLGLYGILNWLGMWEGAWESIKEAFRMASGS